MDFERNIPVTVIIKSVLYTRKRKMREFFPKSRLSEFTMQEVAAPASDYQNSPPSVDIP